MNLSIDFNTLTMDEADHLEEATGLGLDAIGKVFSEEGKPKMKVVKAIAAVAFVREHGGTMKAALEEIGKLPISDLTNGLEVTAEDHPTDESAQ